VGIGGHDVEFSDGIVDSGRYMEADLASVVGQEARFEKTLGPEIAIAEWDRPVRRYPQHLTQCLPDAQDVLREFTGNQTWRPTQV
jgi:hypothetical protein